MLKKSKKQKRGKTARYNVVRVPIILRKPSITRTPIIRDKRIQEYSFEMCKLDKLKSRDTFVEIEGCTKDKYMVLNPLTTRSKKDILSLLNSYHNIPYFYLNTDRIVDIQYTLWLLKEFSSRNLPVYLTTSCMLPEVVLQELSKNPYNVIQCNFSEFSDDSDDYESKELYIRHKKLKKLPYLAKTYGIYVVLRIEPVIPGVTRISRLLSLVSAIKNQCNHITISFLKLKKSSEEGLGYLKYKESILDKNHFELDGDTWVCSDDYKTKVLSQLKLFSNNKSLSVCGDTQCKYCRGMRLKSSIKDGDMFVLNTKGYFERKAKKEEE